MVADRSTERGLVGRTIGLDATSPHTCPDGRPGCRRHRRWDHRSGAGGSGRRRRRPGRSAPDRGSLRPPGRGGLRQGQQRRRRARRRSATGRLGSSRRPVRPRRLRPARLRPVPRPGRPGGRRHVRHRLPGPTRWRRRLRRRGDVRRTLHRAGGRHPVRRRRPHRGGPGTGRRGQGHRLLRRPQARTRLPPRSGARRCGARGGHWHRSLRAAALLSGLRKRPTSPAGYLGGGRRVTSGQWAGFSWLGDRRE